MNTLRYKGFIGSVNFSEEDSVFFGKIEGINGMVNFEGQSVQELTEAFQESDEHFMKQSMIIWLIVRKKEYNRTKAIQDH